MSDRTIVKESGHWYAKDGTQVLEVPKAKGDGWKKTTLREARTMNLAPGVTTIIKCAHAPQLDRWKQRQAIMSALTLPRTPDESEDDWLRRIEVDMGETARKAAEEGTRIHAALEAAISGEPFDEGYRDHVDGVQRLLWKLAGVEAKWVAEKGVTHPYGYGTKADLHDADAHWLLDFKGKDGDQAELEKLRTYDSHWMQLAATRAALESNEWGYPHEGWRYEGPRRRCGIIYVSRTHPGACHVVEVTAEQLDQGWRMFDALLRYWQARNRYTPDWQ
jgi:hypothetical protein